MLTIMSHLDPAGELLRISAHYRQMTDDELLDIARDSSELTQIAQQALADEMSQRRLKLQPEPPPPPQPAPDEPTGSAFDDDRKLISVSTVWSLRDALQLQSLLDTAGIPFFMGPENADGAEAVTSNFAEGVDVKIMEIGLPWARQVLQDYTPADAPKDPEPTDDVPVRCPKCHSEEVVFEDLLPGGSGEELSRYKWKCDSCGSEWEDDGVVED